MISYPHSVDAVARAIDWGEAIVYTCDKDEAESIRHNIESQGLPARCEEA